MQAQNMKLILLSLFLLFSQVITLSDTIHEEIHEDSQFPKVVTLDDQSVLVFSSIIGEKKCLETKLDKKGEYIYGDIPHTQGLSGSDLLTSPHDGTNKNSILFHHGDLPYEMITTYNQNTLLSSVKEPKSRYFAHKSIVALKSGKIVIAGIVGGSNENVLTDVDINIYDPTTQTFGTGLTFGANGKLVSCYEHKENQVYCAFVSQQYPFVSKLILQHIEVNSNANTMASKSSQVIKTFYTVFNYLKAVPFSDTQAIILFRVGNGEALPKYGNSGQDLFFYQYELSNEEGALVKGIRYESLVKVYESNKNDPDTCRFRKDEEDESIDIAVLSPKRIYIACETGVGKLKGFIIYPEKTKIDEFYFNNFEAKDVKNPVFGKFEKSLGIFYTHINENNNYNVDFHLMNYPECYNYYNNKVYLIPKRRTKEIDFRGFVFLNNPYPAKRIPEVVSVKFSNPSCNMTILDDSGKALVLGNVYDPEELSLKITPQNVEGLCTIPYMATRDDELDGLIEGKTCKITIDVPKCLPQCDSCTALGTVDKHACLGCASLSFYQEAYDGAKNEGWGLPHNCWPCDEACKTCTDKFKETPTPSTHCIKCDYEKGFYHFFKNEEICISANTQDYWEGVFNRSIYLDKSSGTDETKWRWKYCHINCKKCSGPGDDIDNQCDLCVEDLHFFCNQTKGNGIPGSCHANCVNNGFFLKPSEGMEKCCPCLDKCKVCPDENTCNECYDPFYIAAPNKDACVDDCGYCYAKDDHSFGVKKCVNCKDDFTPAKYNLNGTCYDRIPLISYEDPDVKNKPHHVVDDTCNWLMGCKDGCFKCETWYSEKCTKCWPGFYRLDTYSLPNQPSSFPCFTERECQGFDTYQFLDTYQFTSQDEYDGCKEIGGVPKEVNGEEVCYNCRLREGTYRQVENDFTCGPRAKRTYVDIPYYNKLSKCYMTCASCEQFGNACKHNCLTCRDASVYCHYPYNETVSEGQCLRCGHKCGLRPYYHNYDLAETLGLSDDNCGQECDVCLDDFKCPEDFPFYVIATRECVEVCGINEILGETCTMNGTKALEKIVDDPFDLNGTTKELPELGDIAKLIQMSIIQKYALELHIDIETISSSIYNYIGNGKIFNLPKSQIILGNNISIELTTSELELLKLYNLQKQAEEETPKTTSQPTTTTTSDSTAPTTEETTTTTLIPDTDVENPPIVDLSQCETILKKFYNLSYEEKLIILKGTSLKEFEQYLGKDISFNLISTSLWKSLSLEPCKDLTYNYNFIFNPANIMSSPLVQNRIASVVQNGYDAFSVDSIFYNDICTPFTNENGNDVLLDERRKDYFQETLNLCKDGCSFLGFNISTLTYSCECPIDNSENKEIITQKIPEDFYKKHTFSNIKVFKCASQVFSKEGQKKNFGSYTLLGCFTSMIGVIVFFCMRGSKLLQTLFSGFNNVSNPPKNEGNKVQPEDKSNPDSIEKSIKKGPEEVHKDDFLTDEMLDNASFEEAKEKDDRSYKATYCSLLKRKQLIAFTFITGTDGNLRVIKIGLFILFVSFYFAYTALFFNDSIMRNIYIYKGNTDAAVHVPNIILSSLCCLIMNILVKLISLSDRDLIQVKKDKSLKDKILKKIKIKTYITFGISIALIALCWYYVAAFCAVFKNSQKHYFINVLIAFIVCNLWPCVTTLIAPAMRRYSLKNDSSCMYKASKIVAYI